MTEQTGVYRLTEVHVGSTTYFIEMEHGAEGAEDSEILRAFGRQGGEQFPMGEIIRANTVGEVITAHATLANLLIEKVGAIRTGQYDLVHTNFWRKFFSEATREITESIRAEDDFIDRS